MADKKIKVGYVSHFSHMKMGGQRSMYFLINALDRTKFEPFAICPKPGELSENLKKIDCPSYHAPLFSVKPKFIHKFPSIYSGLRRIIKVQKPDILHPDYPADMFFCSLAKSGTGAKLVWHVRWNAPSSNDKLYEKLPDGIIGVSDAAGRRFSDTPEIRNKYRTIYNGVDTSRFSPAEDRNELRKKLDIPENRPVVMFAGVFKEGKGIFDLLQAAQLIAVDEEIAELPLFLLIGSHHGEESKQKMQQFMDGSPAKELVRIIPQQTNIEEWMAASDILTIPSHEGNEGMPRVMYEAMACGAAVIGSDTSGVREAVTPESGMLVPQETPPALAEAVKILINNKNMRQKLQENGRLRALDLFDIDKHARRVEEFYLEILGRK